VEEGVVSLCETTGEGSKDSKVDHRVSGLGLAA
jgi:hypothetical protein